MPRADDYEVSAADSCPEPSVANALCRAIWGWMGELGFSRSPASGIPRPHHHSCALLPNFLFVLSVYEHDEYASADLT